MTIPYTLIDHTADFGIHVFGPDLEALFLNAGLALFDLIVPDGDLKADLYEDLSVTGDDDAELMVNWLRELLYRWTGEEKLVKSIQDLKISEHALSARIFYDTYDPGRHTIRHEIKAVTYHQAEVKKTPSCWEARVILDI